MWYFISNFCNFAIILINFGINFGNISVFLTSIQYQLFTFSISAALVLRAALIPRSAMSSTLFSISLAFVLKITVVTKPVIPQSVTKCLAKRKNIRQNWAISENFGICLCVIFGCIGKNCFLERRLDISLILHEILWFYFRFFFSKILSLNS